VVLVCDDGFNVQSTQRQKRVHPVAIILDCSTEDGFLWKARIDGWQGTEQVLSAVIRIFESWLSGSMTGDGLDKSVFAERRK